MEAGVVYELSYVNTTTEDFQKQRFLLSAPSLNPRLWERILRWLAKDEDGRREKGPAL